MKLVHLFIVNFPLIVLENLKMWIINIMLVKYTRYNSFFVAISTCRLQTSLLDLNELRIADDFCKEVALVFQQYESIVFCIAYPKCTYVSFNFFGRITMC